MAVDPVTAQGIAGVLGRPPGIQQFLDDAVIAGRARLKEAIGSTNWTALLGGSLTQDEQDACVYAGKRYGAQAYYRQRTPPVTTEGVVFTTTLGDEQRSHASSDEVARIAVQWGNEARRMLERVGLYQRPSLAVGTLVLSEEGAEDP